MGNERLHTKTAMIGGSKVDLSQGEPSTTAQDPNDLANRKISV